ncbi:MAG: PaaI family thioesterase [Pseudomonadota bacterium]
MPKSVFDDLGNKPPAAELIGWELMESDKQRKWVKIAFAGRPEFTNPTGFVQGGLLAAMLDELMGSAIIVATDGAALSTTISLTVDVNRRSIGTPYRRAKGTPLLRCWVVDAGRGFRAAGGVGRA